ncbi:MAG: hypothetical protein HQL71_07285 [Magnetococcales bacterium]|nr:hypothetical protein [Magnetococcales bacterium]
MPLYCQTISITGQLENLTRSQAARLIVEAGGVFSRNMNSQTTLLVKGAKANKSLPRLAASIGAAVITEDDLVEMLGVPYTGRLPGLLVEVK